MSGVDGLPTISSADLPAAIRHGSKADQDNFKAAMGFEQMLVRNMLQDVVKDSSDLGEGVYADQIADAMATAVQSAGGIGLAGTLAKTLGAAAAAATTTGSLS
jgi:Rod binding domain-containing protein